MSSSINVGAARRSRISLVAGHVLSALVVLMLIADGVVPLVKPELVAQAMAETGFGADLGSVVSGIAILCGVVYAIPRTCVLGAILITGFVGGAICTHLRVGEMGTPPQIICALIGIAAWAGLYLRLEGLRRYLPLTQGAGSRP